MDPFRLSFVGVGPQRTGSSWLHNLLADHPALCLPKDVKETMFFDRYYRAGLPWYASHFAHCKSGQLCGEIGSTYLDLARVAEAIRQHNPDCRIIINLRNPIERARSLHLHHWSKGRAAASFTEAVSQKPRIVDSGRYGIHVPRWLDLFGRDRVHFVWLDDVQYSPSEVFASLCDFLGVERMRMPAVGQAKTYSGQSARFPMLSRIAVALAYKLRSKRFYKLIKLGKTLGFKRLVYGSVGQSAPRLTPIELERLAEVYEPDICYLECLLGRDLSAWRRQAEPALT